MNLIELYNQNIKYIDDVCVGDKITIINLDMYSSGEMFTTHSDTYYIGAQYYVETIEEPIHGVVCPTCTTYGICMRMEGGDILCGCILGDEYGRPLRWKRNTNSSLPVPILS